MCAMILPKQGSRGFSRYRPGTRRVLCNRMGSSIHIGRRVCIIGSAVDHNFGIFPFIEHSTASLCAYIVSAVDRKGRTILHLNTCATERYACKGNYRCASNGYSIQILCIGNRAIFEGHITADEVILKAGDQKVDKVLDGSIVVAAVDYKLADTCVTYKVTEKDGVCTYKTATASVDDEVILITNGKTGTDLRINTVIIDKR